ncbi:MAG: VCBS repeat-containing protein, partial [Cyclobacteriaceae bacterium]|nr:VCBS repeat-containing protein [Cyclobacteriaceae bacterium]
MHKFLLTFTCCLFLLFTACKKQETTPTLFTSLDPTSIGIDFENNLTYTEEFNIYTYRNFYNGGGVGLGDVNNDGLTDIYFTGNLVDNKLYLNKGNFQFEDITHKAGVASPGVWSTGVSMADVNGDGWLDIYVCKSGSPKGENRHNELFINNGDLTFTERAREYGLADKGLSTHAAFFDYDKDGDLDCYLLNNSFTSTDNFDLRPGMREIRDSLGGNKLYRNEGEIYTDVSTEAGIYGSSIGFGLGVTIGDVNRDGWQDIYVSNDFFEKDYLYFNNGDGTFTENLEASINELSMGAMGADLADINNDGLPEIFVTEMLPEKESRLKTKSMFEDWDKYTLNIKNGYYRQFGRNVLQLNRGIDPKTGFPLFSEIGRLAGVEATDWSWGALIADFDNDGFKDLFVANGIYKDILDQDYISMMANPTRMREMINTDENALKKLVDAIPSEPLSNYLYANNGDLTFTNKAKEWGLGTPGFSNGSAYGDLDNDGDLDLVVSNVNQPPFIYQNNTNKTGSNFLHITLKGKAPNTKALGAQVELRVGGKIFYQELSPMRTFESSVDPRLHFGLGINTLIDTMLVYWPDGLVTSKLNVESNQFLTVDANSAVKPPQKDALQPNPLFTEVTSALELNTMHQESDFNDFSRDGLLFNMTSNEGPALVVADINNDARPDIYLGGAKGHAGVLLVQRGDGTFEEKSIPAFTEDRVSEDVDALFFDADNDGDQDLYVCSGSNETSIMSFSLADRLYINNGRGDFNKSPQILPVPSLVSTSCVKASDFDRDGDIDLFVGGRFQRLVYGLPASGFLLANDGTGAFTNVTEQMAPGLKELGMITDMAWTDIDNDGDEDMVIVGEWMPVKIFLNNAGIFSESPDQNGLSNTAGLWNTLKAADLDNDGNTDIILGNHGQNT